jgi:hypothetical protein
MSGKYDRADFFFNPTGHRILEDEKKPSDFFEPGPRQENFNRVRDPLEKSDPERPDIK